MKLNFVQKQNFYHELNQFLKSGIALPQAVEALSPEIGDGALRRLLRRLQTLFLQGETVAEAFAQLRPAIGEMEVALISASSYSGRLEQALGYLADYFGALEELRASLVKQLTWPIVQLHLGFLIVPVTEFYLKGDLAGYLWRVGNLLVCLYAGAALVWLGVRALVRAAGANVAADRFLRGVPLAGAVRRNVALNRFCATYEMQLEAAINPMDSLRAAADASQSAVIRREIERVLPRVRAGEQVSSLLAGSRAFPTALQRVFRVGEQTGSLDEDLRKWAEYYRKTSAAKMEAAGKWLVRLLNLAILLYLGYCVIRVGQQYLGTMQQAIDGAL